jgi:hypothetical protein
MIPLLGLLEGGLQGVAIPANYMPLPVHQPGGIATNTVAEALEESFGRLRVNDTDSNPLTVALGEFDDPVAEAPELSLPLCWVLV